jgi:predicted protein tyrosine phosphatase
MRHLVSVTVILTLGMANPVLAQQYIDPASYLRNFARSNNVSEGLRTYPYQTYLARSKFIEIANIQRTRISLNFIRPRLGDRFVAYLGETYGALTPGCSVDAFDAKNTDALIGAGLSIIAHVQSLRGSDRTAYRLYFSLAYFLLSNASECIAQDIERNSGWLNDFMKGKRVEHQGRIDLLRGQHVYVRIPESQLEKARVALKNCIGGDCEYLLSRIPRWIKNREPNSIPVSLENDRLLHPSAQESSAHILKMMRGNEDIGSVVFMPRNLVNVEYLADAGISRSTTMDAAYRKIWDEKRKLGQDVIVATTGGFTNAQREPEGLVTQDGRTINPVLRPDQDDLVLLEPNGSARVVNLRSPVGFQLPGLNHFVNPRLRFIDYAELMEWINDKSATVFQTQLLAWDDSVLVRTAAPRQARERRMFAAVRDKQENLRLVLFDITKQYALLDQTDDVIAMLKRRNLRVVWLLNLDVGSFNILEMYDEAGTTLARPHGPLPIASATNLLIFTLRQ